LVSETESNQMIKVTVTPKSRENIYGLMFQKERSLRKRNTGTLHRYGPKKKDEDKWRHNSFSGWVKFQKCLGGVVVAVIQSKDHDAEWQLLTSFIGFHFRESISNISLTYEFLEE